MLSSEDLREFLANIEAAYTKRLLIAWHRDPESFPEYLKLLEEVIDLRRKLGP
jgi:hypothetical protein